MTSPTAGAIEISVTELLRQAKQLGLVWGFRPGEVIRTSTPYNNFDCTARYDGDVDNIPATSIVGGVVPGERVILLYIPPNGNYIIGRLSEQVGGPSWGEISYADESGDGAVLLTSSYQLIFDHTLELPNLLPRVYHIAVTEDSVRSDAVISIVDFKLTYNDGFNNPDVNGENITLGSNWLVPVVAGFNSGGTSAMIPGRMVNPGGIRGRFGTIALYAKENVGTNCNCPDTKRRIIVTDGGPGIFNV